MPCVSLLKCPLMKTFCENCYNQALSVFNAICSLFDENFPQFFKLITTCHQDMIQRKCLQLGHRNKKTESPTISNICNYGPNQYNQLFLLTVLLAENGFKQLQLHKTHCFYILKCSLYQLNKVSYF